MKSIILFLLLGFYSISMASDCQYYTKKVQYYQNKLLKTTSICDAADVLELLVNNLGSAKNACANGYELDSQLRQMSALLMDASIKCKH